MPTPAETCDAYISVDGSRAVVHCPDGYYAIAIALGGEVGPVPCEWLGPYATSDEAVTVMPTVPYPVVPATRKVDVIE
jgi:hypothetical protein